MDESLMPVVALTLAALIALCFGLLAAAGGRIGRWIGAALLVLWILWVGEILIERTYPHWLYTPEEKVYMARLEQAILDGKERVPLEELVPFKWSAVCVAEHLHYDKASEAAHQAVKQVTGEDVLKGVELNIGEGERVLIFATAAGPKLIRDLWEDIKQVGVVVVFENTRHVPEQYCDFDMDVVLKRIN